MRPTGNAAGQASTELLLAAPLIACVLALGWQIVVAGHTWWKIAEVARLSARERYVAGQRGDPKAALARSRQIADALLASSPAASRRVSSSSTGRVTVSAKVPLVAPLRLALGAAGGPLLTASSRMAP
jgi:hypothetical protein